MLKVCPAYTDKSESITSARILTRLRLFAHTRDDPSTRGYTHILASVVTLDGHPHVFASVITKQDLSLPSSIFPFSCDLTSILVSSSPLEYPHLSCWSSRPCEIIIWRWFSPTLASLRRSSPAREDPPTHDYPHIYPRAFFYSWSSWRHCEDHHP